MSRRHEPAWLYLDVDAGQPEPEIGRIQTLLARAGYRVAALSIGRSPSGTGWHVRVLPDPQPATPMEMVALQAVLGSDPFREACNVARVRALPRVEKFWQKRWNVLYLSHGGVR